MAYIIGIDGGGSKTYAVICDEHGNRLGTGIAGGGNHQSIGMKQSLLHIQQSIESALLEAGLKEKDIDFVQYGLSGADREKDFNIILPALSTLPFSKWDVVCDTMEGLRTGSSAYTGVVLVCGSGTNAAGRNEQGETTQTGGFGTFYGDWGGGGELAKETFRAAIRSWEYREIPSLLTTKVPRYFGFSSVEEMFHSFLDEDRYDVPIQLTQVLHEAADEGDQLSISILEKAGQELGLAANSVIKRLGGFNDTVKVVLTGSVLQKGKNKYLLESLCQTLSQESIEFELVIPKMEPVYGSILLAMDRLGLPVTKDIENKFASYGGYEK
ncbi:N-acetylglucosamine kinase [Bacillus alkalicellulosilyticus]|uniref:N-acetylglucosamine kinase n=1 Tax=Alkalihalobacterium alkalicellulosilyticum TaxID=1912214 RepID=UPI00099609EB|nr:BadF/BadG/BcrA/BcrD ATPase family protein [Bacillus alkalicellulosilyticus]